MNVHSTTRQRRTQQESANSDQKVRTMKRRRLHAAERRFSRRKVIAMWFGFDPLYFLFLAPGILLATWAQFRIQSAYARASQIPAQSGYTGAQAAAALLGAAGVPGFEIDPVEGFLSDHY